MLNNGTLDGEREVLCLNITTPAAPRWIHLRLPDRDVFHLNHQRVPEALRGFFPVMHHVALLDLRTLAAVQPLLQQEILLYVRQSIELTIQGTLTEVNHAHHCLLQRCDPIFLAQLRFVTIRWEGGRIDNTRHQRALIRSFNDMFPNLRRLNIDARIDLQFVGRRLQAAASLPGGLRPFLQDQAQRYSDRLNLDGTILRENTIVVITICCILHGDTAMFMIGFLVRRPIGHLLM